MHLRYKFRLEPTLAQQRSLAMAFGCARVVYNDALAARKSAHAAGLPHPRKAVLMKSLITNAKRTPERAWLAKVSHTMLQAAIHDLDVGYQYFFASIAGKRPGRIMAEPKFRSSKDGWQSIRFTGESFSVHANGLLHLCRVGNVKVRWSRDLPSRPSAVSVIKDSSGRYFASFVVVTDPADDLDRFPAVEPETGIDLGLTHFAVLSDGRKIDAPKFLRRAEKKLKKLQRSMDLKQDGSSNRAKARTKLAKQHAHVADARRDFHHKLSTMLIRENQAVYVEDLAVSGLGRTRLAKSVHDAGWGQFCRMLEYKASRYGRAFGRVDRWAPTSQVCSACGVGNGKKPLHVREWTCCGCGAVHDRDVNAAKNVLHMGRQLVAAGRAETLNACGGKVRPQRAAAPADEAGTQRGDQSATTGAVGISAHAERTSNVRTNVRRAAGG